MADKADFSGKDETIFPVDYTTEGIITDVVCLLVNYSDYCVIGTASFNGLYFAHGCSSYRHL